MLLASFIAAVALGGAPAAAPTPTPTPTPAPKVLSTDVRAEAAAAGFGAHADRLAQASRGAAVLRAGRRGHMPATIGSSRFGGNADLPAGRRWPSCKGKPQTFLAQVRVADLPPEADELRRVGGTLLFFTYVLFEADDYAYGLDGGSCSTVVHAGPGAKLRRVARPKRTLRIGAAPMRFTGRPDVPGLDWDDVPYPPLQDIEISDWERYFNLRWGLLGLPNPGHQLLGYPDEPNGGNACSEAAKRPVDPLRHLFTMDWDQRLGYMVADGGRLQMLIAPEDLRRGRFDRVCGVFDSA